MLGQNLRYLMWSESLSQESWAGCVADASGLSQVAAEKLLAAGTAQGSILVRLSERFGIAAEELLFADLLSQSNLHILGENLKYLLEGEEHGKNRRLAEALGVNDNTVSGWISNRGRPRGVNLDALLEYFDLPQGTDLISDPLFLSLEPISGMKQRQWLIDRIGELSCSELSPLYPALRKLLS